MYLPFSRLVLTLSSVFFLFGRPPRIRLSPNPRCATIQAVGTRCARTPACGRTFLIADANVGPILTTFGGSVIE